MVPNWHPFTISFLEIGRSHRVPNQGGTVGGGADEAQCRHQCAAASGQLSESWAQIWLRCGACPILMSEPIGMSHNQFPPP
jgi:hypothetical protein